MAIGEIFDRLKKYLQQIFRLFAFFGTKEYKVKDGAKLPLDIGDQKAQEGRYDGERPSQIEELNENLEEQKPEEQEPIGDEERNRQHEVPSVEPDRQEEFKKDRLETKEEPAERNAEVEGNLPPDDTKKPYIKKIPISTTQTESKERAQRDYPRKEGGEEEKIINLAQTRARKTHVKPKRSIRNGEIKETKEKINNGETSDYEVARPFMELNIDSKAISIVLPEQRVKPDGSEQAFTELNYRLKINDEWQDIPARAILKKECLNVCEQVICSEKPIKEFEVAFPDRFKRRYQYKHEDGRFYFFFAVGNDLGRLLYSTERLPRRLIWILLTGKYEIVEYNAIRHEGIYYDIWGKYKPFLVDLRNMDILTIKNKETQEKIEFHCDPSFNLTGDYLVEDDFKLECPLFRGDNLKINAPYENEDGWSVWIQNKIAGSRLISKKWTGSEPLALDCSKDLPCDFGEFQIDFVGHNENINDTLFFRWIPSIELNYPKDLVIPDCETGHAEISVALVLDKNKEWKLKDDNGNEINSKQAGCYELCIISQKERCCFSVGMRQGEVTLRLGVRIPRLKWKLSNQEKWHDKTLSIKKTDLLPEKLLDLLICTNDCNKEYEFTGSLEIKEQAQKVQTETIKRKGIFYAVNINQFYDTIRHYNSNLILKVEGKSKGDGCLCSVEAIQFKLETAEQKPKVAIRNLIAAIDPPKLCSFFRKIETKLPKEKKQCKEIRQLYYRKLKKKKKLSKSEENRKIKREFILRSLALLDYLMDKHAGDMKIRNRQKIDRWIFTAQEKYSVEFKNYRSFYS